MSLSSDLTKTGNFRQQHMNLFQKSLRGGSEKDMARNRLRKDRSNTLMSTNSYKHTTAIFRERNLGKDIESTHSQKTDIFQRHCIEEIMNDILEANLAHQVYNADVCRELCLILSEKIKIRVKELQMNRFRIICNVCIGENNGQGFLMASRFLWDESQDNFSTSTYKNHSLFAVATVFGVFKE